MKNSEGECLTEGCSRKPIARGLCKTCYYCFLQQVLRGTTTWGELIAKKKCKPAKRYHGLTTTVRRKNALAAIDYRDSLKDQVTP